MRTITFYSYKGGVGRTLAVANVARYLARFGHSVFAMDFDLESPGLHYKLAPDMVSQIRLGVVDYIHSFAAENETPTDLTDYVLPLPRDANTEGTIHLMPAGNVACAEYWRRLARIDWHALFYSDSAPGSDPHAPPTGLHHFLELKARIEEEYRPNFLLIDSRTGITEIGGVATSVLSDCVVCLLLNNQENLDGARAVLRSIAAAQRLPGQEPIQLLPVLSRVPRTRDPRQEQTTLRKVREFLSQEAEVLAETPALPEPIALHSGPQPELAEAPMEGGDTRDPDLSLLADYLPILAHLLPTDAPVCSLTSLSHAVLAARAIDGPARVQREPAEVAISPHDTDGHLALLSWHDTHVSQAAPVILYSSDISLERFDSLQDAHITFGRKIMHGFVLLNEHLLRISLGRPPVPEETPSVVEIDDEPSRRPPSREPDGPQTG